jgi:ATP-dependent Lon protease
MFENLKQIRVQEFEDDDASDFFPIMSFGEEEEDEATKNDKIPTLLPILPLKNTVLFPNVVIPITVGREKSLKAVQTAFEGNKYIGVLSQRDSESDDISVANLFEVGTAARILRLMKMPDGSVTVFLKGIQRFKLLEMPFLQGEISLLSQDKPEDSQEFEALIATVREKAAQIIELSAQIPNEAQTFIRNINSEIFLLNFIASNMNLKTSIKQEILEIDNTTQRAEMILQQMDAELQVLELKSGIEQKVRSEMDKQQRDYILNQQLKTIQEELGGNPQEEEITRLTDRAATKKWPDAMAQHFTKELARIKRTQPQMPDYSIQLNYLETLLDLPWNAFTKDNFDLNKVKKTLDQDHYGLEDVKKRILEHLAVLKLKGDMKAPILLLLGPPGVGKTSLGKSIANALGRKFIRMSLGGLSDEAEIRGHRKTYIGALPGRVVQGMKKAGSGNPVFILDEIDKVGNSFRGDPSSALLEVLDPEQNASFYDNYLELEYDLSKVLFIATANSLESIQPALLDRMEIIRIAGYSIEEKTEIAKQHLVPEQRKAHGLKPQNIQLSDETISTVIANYTRESGVRSLDRNLASVMRAVAKKVAMRDAYNTEIQPSDLKELLGSARFSNDIYEEEQIPGVAIGLAWTAVGGDILFIETLLSKGKGALTLTGNLGAVMKESASTALSFLKSHASEFNLESSVFDENDVHIPEGAIPKDGPSAGITMLTALASAFLKKSIKPHLAMSGEITLRGKVLPVGGIKEKILAAKRAHCKHIILCQENRKDIEEINPSYLEGLTFHYVSRMSEVLKIALN